MPSTLQFEQWVPFPIERVFAFFSNPENLPRIMPVSTSTQIIRINRIAPPPMVGAGADQAANQAVGPGSTIVTSFRLFPFLPIRSQWISRIAEFEWNHHFTDVQEQGPFQSWHHRHEFARETRHSIDGTVVRDAVGYEVGFGVLGDLANRLFIARRMLSTFEQRQRALPQLLA